MLLLLLLKILKEQRLTTDKDIHDLIELANYGLPGLRNRADDLLNHVADLQSEKTALDNELHSIGNSIHALDAIYKVT